MRVPEPPQLARELGRLTTSGFVIRRGDDLAITPEGTERVRELIEDIDPAALEPEVAMLGGVVLGTGLHSVLPWTLAPVRWRPAIARLLATHPFERNVFCMTRFPRSDRDDDPIAEVIDQVRRTVERHGLYLHVASDRLIDDDLLANIAGYMWACKFGVALFEDRVSEGLNKNVVIEVGAMLMTGRRCALLRDTTAPPMPTDLVGHIYKSVDFADLMAVDREMDGWVAKDLATDLTGGRA